MTFEKAGKIVSKIVNQKGWGKIASSAQICYEAEKAIALVFPNFHNKIEVKSFDNGILKIASPNAAINQEIQLQKESLIKKMNQNLGSSLIKNLRFSLK